MKKILCVGLVVSFGVILSLGFSKKSYAKIDHNFSFSDGGNIGGGGGNQQSGGSQQIKNDDFKLHYWKTDLPSDGVYHWYETSFELNIDINDFYLCYDASGGLDDDWSNQMMYLKITFLK